MELTQGKCIPCEVGAPKLNRETTEKLLQQTTGWEIVGDFSTTSLDKITKHFKFKNFKEAMAFLNKIAELAENEGHHPDFTLYGWNKVKIELSTHASKGLTENDFIMAAKINELIS